MPTPNSLFPVIRSELLNAYDQLALVSCSDELLQSLQQIAGAVYELNRGALVSALTSRRDASAAVLRFDIRDNLRRLLISGFESGIEDNAITEMLAAASAIRQTVWELPV